MTNISFMKMHGLGNDFVVIDRRERDIAISPELARALGDRQRGIGFDQLVAIDVDTDAAARLTFWNADGSQAGACGNATRCIARHLMTQTGTRDVSLRTERGLLIAKASDNETTAVNLGSPLLGWRDIPLSHEMATDALDLPGAPVATGMGNPHCTFFVEDVSSVDLNIFGPEYEHHPFFPERTNVQIAHLVSPDHLRMRVWERGVGVTLASGSSSCAAAVAAHRRGLTGRAVRIDLDGGTLYIDWRDDGVWMTGPTAHVCDGVLRSEWLEQIT